MARGGGGRGRNNKKQRVKWGEEFVGEIIMPIAILGQTENEIGILEGVR